MRSKEQGDLYREPEGVTAYACSAGDSVYVYEFLVDLGLAAARFRDWPSNGPVRARVLVGDVDADGSITSAEWGRSWGAGGWLIPSGSPASALSAAIHPVLRQADSRRWNALRTYVPVTAGVVIAVVHLFLFAFYPAAKENLAMAALALAGVYVLVWMGSLRSSDLQVMAGIFLAWSITGLGYWLLHEVLSMPRTRRFWVYVATVLLMAATHVARSRGAVEFIAEEVFLTAAVLLLLELFRVIITEALRGNREGLLVGMAFLAFSGLFFSDQPWTLWGQAEASLMLMTVLLSLHLVRRAARTSRLLARANAEIEAATRNKSQFLRRMSHDLRSPMNAIIGYTRVVLRRSRDRLDERQVRNLENIGTSSNNLLSLINDILDLSRIEAGRIEVDVQPVDLRQLADECADALGSIVKPGVELRRQLSDVGQIQTDPDRLRQVVMNLLGNATKFTDTGSITLSLRSADGTVELSVADTGVGIPPEDLPHIFDEFRQVERQGGEQTEGTGLGLAIAKKTVELLGGTLSAVSAGGAGTTFTLRIGDYETA
jgi:signal transduction histidine kinase